MSATITIQGLDKLQAGVAAAPATLAREVRTALVAGSKAVIATARELVPRDEGKLADSITHAITGGGADLTSTIGPTLAYGIVVEKGRTPGKPPPPIAAIRAWGLRHGFEERSLFILARAIGIKGTKARPFLRPALERNQARVVAEFAKVGIAVVVRMAG